MAVYRRTPLLFTQDVGEHDGGDGVDHGFTFRVAVGESQSALGRASSREADA